MIKKLEILSCAANELSVYEYPPHLSEDTQAVKKIIPKTEREAFEKIFILQGQNTDTQNKKNVPNFKDIKIVQQGLSPYLNDCPITIQDITEQAQNRISEPFEGLYAVENPNVGVGIFTQKKIKKGTVIGIYPGTIVPESFHEKGNHKDYLASFYLLQFFDSADQQVHLNIDAHGYRGLCALIQHAPLAHRMPFVFEELDWLNLNMLGVNEFARCATANVVFQSAIVNHKGVKIPVLCYVTVQDINPHEQILISYNYRYWAYRSKQASPFDKKSGLILTKDEFILPKEFKHLKTMDLYLKAIELLKNGPKSLSQALDIFIHLYQHFFTLGHQKTKECCYYIALTLVELAKLRIPEQGWNQLTSKEYLDEVYLQHDLYLASARQVLLFNAQHNQEKLKTGNVSIVQPKMGSYDDEILLTIEKLRLDRCNHI